MSSDFDRPLYGYRFAETMRGDSLQSVAARELGDAGRWTDLIAYNNLVPPFITDEAALAGPGVILTGELLLVPAPTPVISSTADPDKVFEKDVQLLPGGGLATAGGDFAVVAGRDNLRQALKHRVDTERGDLVFHTAYGSRVRQLLGSATGPTAVLLAAKYTREAVEADPRVERVTSAVASVNGDAVSASVVAQPVAGREVAIETTI